MTGISQPASKKVGEKRDDEYELECCTSRKVAQNVHEGHVLGKSGEAIGDVTTNVLNRRRACTIPKAKARLDSTSTVDVFGDRRLLTDMKPAGERLRIVRSADTVLVTKRGTLNSYG